MKKLLILTVATLLVGCGSGPQVIDTSSKQGRVQSLKLVPTDFNDAAAEAIDNMLASRQFARYVNNYEKENDDVPLLMLGKITNKTTQLIDMPVLTETIAEALMNADMVQVTTAAAGEGQLLDASSAQIRDLEYDENFDTSTVQKRGTLKAPNLSLSGAIIEQEAREGRTTEMVYFISLTLTDNRTGVAVWKGNQQIGKQQTRSAIGL